MQRPKSIKISISIPVEYGRKFFCCFLKLSSRKREFCLQLLGPLGWPERPLAGVSPFAGWWPCHARGPQQKAPTALLPVYLIFHRAIRKPDLHLTFENTVAVRGLVRKWQAGRQTGARPPALGWPLAREQRDQPPLCEY